MTPNRHVGGFFGLARVKLIAEPRDIVPVVIGSAVFPPVGRNGTIIFGGRCGGSGLAKAVSSASSAAA